MNRKPYGYAFSIFLLAVIILTHSAQCLSFSLNGLNLWFQKMIPSLFPFMVLSGVIVRMNLAEVLVRFLNPLFFPLFRIRSICLYGLLMGFFCGFPMGAHTASLLYEKKLITRREASFLLAFCNNIGPVYFLSFALPALKLPVSLLFLCGMYLLPFLYGVVLSNTGYRSIRVSYTLSYQSYLKSDTPSLLQALDESIWSALEGIAKLGGYMIFFNLLYILPCLLFQLPFVKSNSQLSNGFLQEKMFCFLEITGGISLLQNNAPVFVLCILPLGGLSCIAQTYSMIRHTDLSISEYLMHKVILTSITVVFYLSAAFLCF